VRFLAVSVGEEMIYRVTAQTLAIAVTKSPAAGILAVALVFSVVHRHFFRNETGQSLEFAVFAILLGVLYYWTGSLILVVVVHAVRNTEIAYLEHVLQLEETEDGESAPEEANGACLRGDPGRI
jgi:membrane protease YdiL (CAAX protease family)